MQITFHGLLCRFSYYRTGGQDRPALFLVHPERDWERALQYDFTELQYGLWGHLLSQQELDALRRGYPDDEDE